MMSEQESQEGLKDSEVVETTAETEVQQQEVVETPEVEVQEDRTIEEKVSEIVAKVEEESAKSEEVVEEAPTYNANYKFKVRNEEREFDDFLKEVVTNEDREKQLRELYEKAYGLDIVKSSYDETFNKYKGLEEQHTKLNDGISSLDAMVKRGDYDGFFENLQIPKEKIYEWVTGKVKYQQATPEERQRLESQQNAQRQAWERGDQLSGLQQQLESQKVDFLQREMDLTMMQPEVKAFAAAYDAQVGKPDAFYSFAKERGETAFALQGKDLTAREAVEEAMGMLKPLVRLPENGQQTTQVQSGQQAPPQQTQKPKVIPNVQSKGNSPVAAAKVRSLEDLKSLYEEKYGS